MRNSRIPPVCGWTMVSVVLFAMPSAAEDSGFRLIAHAVDANAAVFRLSNGTQARVQVGQSIEKSELLLERVTNAGVVLRAREGLNGQPLRWTLRDNESVSLHQLEVVRESRTPQSAQPLAAKPAFAPKTSDRR